jgi:hypothetical protein
MIHYPGERITILKQILSFSLTQEEQSNQQMDGTRP